MDLVRGPFHALQEGINVLKIKQDAPMDLDGRDFPLRRPFVKGRRWYRCVARNLFD